LPNPAQTIFLSLSPGPGAVWVGAIDVQGGWWMFPMAMPITLILVDLGAVSFFLGRGGYRPPCWDRQPSGREAEPPLDILKKR